MEPAWSAAREPMWRYRRPLVTGPRSRMVSPLLHPQQEPAIMRALARAAQLRLCLGLQEARPCQGESQEPRGLGVPAERAEDPCTVVFHGRARRAPASCPIRRGVRLRQVSTPEQHPTEHVIALDGGAPGDVAS